MHAFSISKAPLKSRLVQTYCSSLYGSQIWKLSNRNLDKIRTAWNIIQRKVWRLSRTAHSKYLPILAKTKNLLSQVFTRSHHFLVKAQTSDNLKVRFISFISESNANSVTCTNYNFLTRLNLADEIQGGDEDLRLCSQIVELNECLDGDRVCGMSQDQIRTILVTVGVM